MKYLLLTSLLIIAAGCRKEHDNAHLRPPTPTPIIVGCGYVHATYSGITQPGTHIIPIAGDPTNTAHDIITVYLCKTADCSVAIPPAVCGSAPCYTLVKFPNTSANVLIEKNKVTLTNAKTDGFDNYLIDEYACL